MPEVAVIALGNWGTALANHLALKGHQVIAWDRVAKIVDGINKDHRNPQYQSQVQLSPNLKATSQLSDALNVPYLVVACPSSALSEVVPKLQLSRPSIVISAVKGFVDQSLKTPLQYFAAALPVPASLAVLSGPSFAKDVIAQNPSGVVAASQDESVARAVADLFGSDRMKVYISNDPLGVEIGGIVKNVVALAAGVSDGMSLGESAKAGLITRGLAEMMRLASAMGAQSQTLAGLAGLGDLTMTATCDTSRNRTVGLRLGQGEKLSDIIASLGSVAEGVRSAPLVVALAQRHAVEMPICAEVNRFLRGEVDRKDLIKNLVGRPVRREFD